MTTHTNPAYGKLASFYAHLKLPLHVLQSANGYYIGTSVNTEPVSRESVEYFPSRTNAETAMRNGTWTQRVMP
jgi:hypothetical protein